MKRIISLVLGVMGLINLSHAALTDVGGGLINDTIQNITWLKDANHIKTLCDANDPIWQSWPEPNPAVTGNSGTSKTEICALATGDGTKGNGKLNWFEAENWVAHLNTNNYLGYNDWRQPETFQPDASCDAQLEGFGYRYGCTAVGSELSHLFNVTLANPNAGDASNCAPTVNTIKNDLAPNYCFQNVGPFINASAFAYWSGTEWPPSPTTATFNLFTNNGNQNIVIKTFHHYVWPVRNGQLVVAAAPAQPVPSLPVWGLGILAGLIGFIGFRRKMK